ncbi:MAG TPA: hypothetical protein VHA73_06750 [Acidimicrobiales bacterium]|nr:hypothetical protein [Acidimicrobiales bacterium]
MTPPAAPERSRSTAPEPDHQPEALRRLRARTGPLTLAGERALVVAPELRGLFPDGLRRGTAVGVVGDAAVSLTLALAAEATRTGSWLAVLGAPWLAWPAAAELGVAIERTVAVADPGAERWAEAAGALLDGFDLVVAVHGPGRQRVRAAEARRLAGRARQQGSVLVPLPDPFGERCEAWPESTDLHCRADTAEWIGIGSGHGHLTGRRVQVEVGGRRVPRPRRAELWLPGASGDMAVVEPVASVTALRS